MTKLQPKICKMCNQEFIPNSNNQIYCHREHYMTCPVCGKSYIEKNKDKYKFPPTACSKECKVKRIQATSMQKYGMLAPGNNPEAREKSKQTMQKRYGVDHAQQSKTIKQKSIDTWIEKYGVDNPQKVKEIKEKTIQTNMEKYGSICYLNSEEGKNRIDNIMLERYGTTIPLRNNEIMQRCIETNLERYGEANPTKNKQVKNKAIQTSMIRYGVPYPQTLEAVKAKMRDTFIKKYGVDNPSKNKEIIEKIRAKFIEKYKANGPLQVEEIASRIRETNMRLYGVPYYVMLPEVSRSSGKISKINIEIADKLRNIGLNVRLEDVVIDRHSYDIFIPQGNILLEIDPSYTHSIAGNHWNPKGLPKWYHLQKSVIAEREGYRCIHLWDWDSVSKFINLLTVKNTIYDNLSPMIISKEEATEFIDKYSLYDIDDDIQNIVYIGIKYKSKLINLIAFRKDDIINPDWTITGIEHRFNYNVNNGYKKILDYFISNYHPHKITAYSDYSKSNGEILKELGFDYNLFILPNKIWSKGRHAIVDDSSIIPEAMLEDNWRPVYNCGYKVYEKIIE